LNLYDTIGGQYSQVRKADPRVTEMLLRELALQPGKWIADVGSGTGNYALALAERGYHIRAVEPSKVMLSQAKMHPWVRYSRGFAEELPLEDREVDAIICVNAIHHFRDLDRAVREMDRVCNGGRIVILTADVRLAESYWFNDYFPDLFDNNLLRFQPLQDLVVRLRRVSRRRIRISPLHIPDDFADLFCGAAWNRPQACFCPTFRSCWSSLTSVSQRSVEAALRRLANDLETGEFQRRYPYLQRRREMDLGIRILTLLSTT
jgi:ubiquinone/menaquinone biosynthesis C-methylase UbiE